MLTKYRAYFEELCQPVGQEDYNKQQALYWDLLRAIGNEVGYKNMDNKTLHSSYIARGVYNDHLWNQGFQDQLMEFLKSGDNFHKWMVRNEPPPSGTVEDIQAEIQ